MLPCGEVSADSCYIPNDVSNSAVDADALGDDALEQFAYENAPDGLVVLDPNLDLVWASASTGRALGWDTNTVIGRSALEFVHPEDLAHAHGAVSEAGRTDGYHVATRLRLLGGEDDVYHDVRVTATTVERESETWIILGLRPVADEEAIEKRREQLKKLANDFHLECASLEWADSASRATDLLGWLAEALNCESVELGEMTKDRAVRRMCIWDRSAAGHQAGDGGVDANLRPTPPPEPIDDLEELATKPCVVDGAENGIRVRVWLPTQSGGGGVMTVRYPELVDHWDDANADVVGLMCSSLLATLQRTRREKEVALAATTDELTGLINRKELQEGLMVMIDECRAGGPSLALFFADLNNFKALNDTQGHPEGDAALVATAEGLLAATRPDDLAARVGGDEFVVVMRTGEETIFSLNDRLRDCVEEATSPWPAIGVAIGAIAVGPDDVPDDVLKRADQAMYEDKKRGRVDGRTQELATSHEPFSIDDLVGSMSIVIVIGEGGDLIRATDAAAEMFGFEQNALMGTDLSERVHPDDRGSVMHEVFEATEQGREPRAKEIRISDGDGHWRWIQVSASNQLDNPAVAGIVLTITEQQTGHAGRGAADVAAGLGEALDSVDVAVLMFDPLLWVVYASSAAERLLGYTTGTMVGMHESDLVGAASMALMERMNERRRQGIIDRYEVPTRTGTGETLPLTLSVSGVHGTEGEYLGSVTILSPAKESPSRPAISDSGIRAVEPTQI